MILTLWESFFNIIIWVLGFATAFGLAVLVHEFGHFLAARTFGVSVERFVIGFDKEALPFMPKCIWEKKYGETTYGLSLVPLGGYVKMVGPVHPDIERYLDGEPPPDAQQKKPESLAEQAMTDQQALYKKPFWQKFIIYSAGVFMNLVLAMVVAVVLATTGVSRSVAVEPVVSWQKADSILVQSGIQAGDRVIAINGNPIENNREALEAINAKAMAAMDEGVERIDLEFVLLRGQEEVQATLTLPIPSADDSDEMELATTAALRTVYGMFQMPAHVIRVLPNFPADKAGIRAGDTIIAMHGEPVIDWAQFVTEVEASVGRDIPIRLQRTVREVSQEIDTVIRPVESTNPGEEGLGRIGIVGGTPEREIERTDFTTAVANSPVLIWHNTTRYVERLQLLGSRLFRGEVQKVRQDLGGPVVIAQIAGRQAQAGREQFLEFMILLNIALAVMNILPFPVLDGGHIMFAAYEAIFRKPLPPRVLVPVLQGSVLFILAFFLLVTFNDVLRIFF